MNYSWSALDSKESCQMYKWSRFKINSGKGRVDGLPVISEEKIKIVSCLMKTPLGGLWISIAHQ
jgi:hypothetical protein